MKALERNPVEVDGVKNKAHYSDNVFFSILSRLIEGMDHIHDRNSLDGFIRDFARRSLPSPHTGKLYDISLPGIFSGMEASMVRVRTGSFWQRGGNFSFFHFPPRILLKPSVLRLDIVITNLGNWSSSYFNVPNYTFITPVIGFMIYGARNANENGTLPLTLSVSTNFIRLKFPQINVTDDKYVDYKCATFGSAKMVGLSTMIARNGCIVRDQGHFSIVKPVELSVPAPEPFPVQPATDGGKERVKLWKWWVIGFGVGVVGLSLIGLISFAIVKYIRKN